MALDGITLRALVHELQTHLTGGKIDKINQPEKDELILTVRSQKTNYKLLLSASSSTARLHILEDIKKENPLVAPMFLMLLRKHIGNGAIKSIEQRSTERIVEIAIEAYDELRVLKNKLLIIELMGKHSNIILVNAEDRKIIDSIKRVSINVSSVREVLPGLTYVYPPSHNKKNPVRNTDFSFFKSLFEHGSIELYKLFYMNYEGLSPTIGKEICYRCNISPTESSQSLSETKIERLWGTFERIMHCVSKHQYNPCIVMQKNPPRILDFSAIMLTHSEEHFLAECPSMNSACQEYYALKDKTERIQQKTSDLRKRVQTRLDMLKNKTEKQNNEISSSMTLNRDKHYGELLTAYIYLLQKGMNEITVDDFYHDNTPITIPLDIHKTPSENIQRYFKRYQKSKNRIAELTEQLCIAQREISYLENVLVSISQIENYSEISEIQNELAKEGYIRRSQSYKKQKEEPSSKPMEFLSSDGIEILVGKNNTQNDKLTLKLSSPNDIWLHTKEIPGSHVILRTTMQNVPEQTLRQAAILSAYFSKARMSANVPVDYTERKNVKKPNGAKPGMVIYEKNATLYVTPDETIVNSLRKKEPLK